jgi:RNA polymerase sigma factor (TIGR02999 family)
MPHALVAKDALRCPAEVASLGLSTPQATGFGHHLAAVSSSAPPASPDDLTALLHDWKCGRPEALSRIVQTLQAEFLRMAGARLRGWDDVSLSRGDVVNEALMRLMKSDTPYADRAHFFATVSLTMRSVLREHARAKQAAQRDGGQRVTLTLEAAAAEESMVADLLTLDALFTRLHTLDPRAARVMDLTYFSGLSREQIAEVMDVSLATVDRELRFARAWLRDALARELEA